jgi:hypothetical protein
MNRVTTNAFQTASWGHPDAAAHIRVTVVPLNGNGTRDRETRPGLALDTGACAVLE